MKLLLAGPWLSEFGWELMTWVPAIRKYSRKFSKTIVICRPGYDYLYMDFADSIIHKAKKGLPDRWLLNGDKVKMPKIIKNLFPDAEVITTRKSVCTEWGREYIKYGMKTEEYKYDLVIHARSYNKYNQRSWNWPVPRYREVVKSLGLKKVCSIGTIAHHIDGTEDLRNIPLGQLCNILASSKVILTPSSGPAHLASLCGCPHVVMTGSKWQKAIGGMNRDRYKRVWNPFGTQCKVLDHHDWQPPVPVVLKTLERFVA